ncbi:hypothetical protein JXA02_11545 [candidate division KSB1 bacterium]|nr:hypothetical protein [candidate division KSB1 bacterium]RQW02313.1 MAG: hypothetical protein EH222_13795 [candidate division KSB1 bacterium]
MDILFLTSGEPNSDANWRVLKSRFPQSQRLFFRQQDAAFRQKLLACIKSDHFFLVAGAHLVAHDFSFAPPHDLEDDTVFVWQSRNPLFHDLLYHFYGIALLPKHLLLSDETFTLSFPALWPKLTWIDRVASDYDFAESPFYGWRAAFLETLNLLICTSRTRDASPYAARLQFWLDAAHQNSLTNWARGVAAAQMVARYTDIRELTRRYSDEACLEKEFQTDRRMVGDQDEKSQGPVSERYSALGMNVRPIGRGKYYFNSELTHIRTMGDDELYSLLQHCGDFDDVHGHALHHCSVQSKRLFQAVAQMHVCSRLLKIFLPFIKTCARDSDMPVDENAFARTTASVSRLIADGVLLSDSFVKREIFRFIVFDRDSSKSDDPMVQSINIPTKNRPHLLKRALESYAQNAALHGHHVVLNVVDDSTDTVGMLENRLNLQAVARRYNLTARYTSRDDREKFATSLHRLGIPLEYCRFCLLGERYLDCKMGASRNTIQLQSIGELIIQVDDDTECRCVQSPFCTDQVALCAHKIFDYIFHPEDTFDATSECADADFVGLHAQLLSANITAPALQHHLTSEKKLDIDDIDSALLKKVTSPTGAIKATFLGSFGDSGEGDSLYRLFMRDRAFQQLVADEKQYEKLLSTRYVTKFVPSLTISDIPSCMTMNIGLDDSVPIPFSPIQRNEDAVFAHLCRIGYLEGLLGFQPFLIRHAPPPRAAPRKEEQFRTTAAWGLNDCINALLLRFRPSSSDAFYNLQQAGRFLVDFAEADDHDFAGAIQDIYRDEIADKMNMLYTVLDEREAGPAFWLADMHHLAQELEKGLTGESHRMLVDLQGDLPARMQKCKFFVNRFGHMLLFWPDMVAAAQELKRTGVCLGSEIHSAQSL